VVIRKEFEDIEHLVDEALSIDCEFGVSFIATYEDAAIILKEVLSYDDELVLFSVEIGDPSFDGYDKEYIISVNNGEVFCEKFYRKDRYLYVDEGINFVLPNCTDECMAHIKKSRDSFVVKVDFDDDIEPCNYCSTHDCDKGVIRDEDGNIIFSLTFGD